MNAYSESAHAVARNRINELDRGIFLLSDAIYLIKGVLIDVAVRCGIAFDSANAFGSRHGRIIELPVAIVNSATLAHSQIERLGHDSVRNGIHRLSTINGADGRMKFYLFEISHLSLRI
jgi:hypothetical protein